MAEQRDKWSYRYSTVYRQRIRLARNERDKMESGEPGQLVLHT